MASHQQSVQDQFNPKAEAYLTSQVHQHGPDMLQARQCLTKIADNITHAVDIGCGAGHLSYALAEIVKHISAVDASSEMIDLVAKQAKQRNLANLDAIHASVEALPFADNSVDIICSRYSAHHWTQMDKAMQEIKRVLKPDGWIMMIDIQGFIDPVVDTYFQAIEIIRDQSHVRNYSDNEWRAFFTEIGFEVTKHYTYPVRLEISAWLERMHVANARAEVIKQMQQQANSQAKQALSIEDDGSFTAVTGLWWARRTAN